MNIEGIGIRELFLDGTLTANAVRIFLEEDLEYNERAVERSDIICPDLRDFIDKRKKGLTIPTSVESLLG
jgi:hypothetical protein